MNDELAVAKRIIADQQIALARISSQIQSHFAVAPNGEIVHIACGSPLMIQDDEIQTSCECFPN